MEFRPILPMPKAAKPLGDHRWVGLSNRLLSSNRFILGMAILLAIIMPALLRAQLVSIGAIPPLSPLHYNASLIAAIAAIAAAHVSLQHIGFLPLVAPRSLILPVFVATFGLVLLGVAVAQIVVDPYIMWVSFLVSLTWYGVILSIRHKFMRPVIALLGASSMIPEDFSADIEWRAMERPWQRKYPAAMVVDPHAPLDVESSQLIAQFVLEGVPVYHRGHFEEGLTGRVRFNCHADNNFGALLPSLTYLRVKRLLDFVAAVLALPFVVPIALAAALIVKIDSPGPMLFYQSRIGYRGRPFTCYKLRTMRVGHDGPAYTLEQDPRLTRVGQMLRKWRIDELPQILNVLKGEMSWIGPRPEAVELATHYAQHIQFYDYRHAVRPGISGWAAVHQGNVGNVDAACEKLEYDFYYIKYLSVWLDFLIFFKTLKTVVSGFGSR